MLHPHTYKDSQHTHIHMNTASHALSYTLHLQLYAHTCIHIPFASHICLCTWARAGCFGRLECTFLFLGLVSSAYLSIHLSSDIHTETCPLGSSCSLSTPHTPLLKSVLYVSMCLSLLIDWTCLQSRGQFVSLVHPRVQCGLQHKDV